MTRICDLPEKEIREGMRIKSLKSDKQGTIVWIDYADDAYAWIKWDGDAECSSGFYGNSCLCEVIE